MAVKKMSVYIDVLFLTNMIINYIILSLSAKLATIKASPIRLILSAMLGAVYAVCMFFPRLSVFYSGLGKVIISLLMLTVAFKIYSIKSFIRMCLSFYLVSISLAGAILCIFYFTDWGKRLGAIYSNGILYFNLPWQMLFIACIVCYIFIKVASFFIGRNLVRKNLILPVKIKLGKNETEFLALLDSGNALSDPISGAPVIVVEYESIKDILSSEAKILFETVDEKNIVASSDILEESGLKIRLIPFSSLGREKGILIGFLPDEMKLLSEGKTEDLSGFTVAVYKNKLSFDKNYQALLSIDVAKNVGGIL